MDANDRLMMLYLATGVLALGCAMLPGASVNGRFLYALGGLGLLVWSANVYFLAGWHPTTPVQYAMPLLPLGYALLSLRRHARRSAEWLSPAYQRSADPEPVAVEPPPPNRRSRNRRVLPGEYGTTPIGTLPPPHDPWAALYASVERELLRGTPGGHRPDAVEPGVRIASALGSPSYQAGGGPTGLPHVPRARSGR